MLCEEDNDPLGADAARQWIDMPEPAFARGDADVVDRRPLYGSPGRDRKAGGGTRRFEADW
jgi:hypothetical protein